MANDITNYGLYNTGTITNNIGTVNIVQGNDKPTNGNIKEKEIMFSPVDRYSSPLKGSLNLSKWGEKKFQVSFMLKNELLGQVIQRNDYILESVEQASNMFNTIDDMVSSLQKTASSKNMHSSLIAPKVYAAMLALKAQEHDPIADDLKMRFQNPESAAIFNEGVPPGLLIHNVEDHFPEHEGIVKDAFNQGMTKTASKEAVVESKRTIIFCSGIRFNS